MRSGPGSLPNHRRPQQPNVSSVILVLCVAGHFVATAALAMTWPSWRWGWTAAFIVCGIGAIRAFSRLATTSVPTNRPDHASASSWYILLGLGLGALSVFAYITYIASQIAWRT